MAKKESRSGIDRVLQKEKTGSARSGKMKMGGSKGDSFARKGSSLTPRKA